MNSTARFFLSAAVGITTAMLLSCSAFATTPGGDEPVRKQMQAAFQQGNFKDAYDGFRSWPSIRRTIPGKWATT